jgi:hypothetical protein
MTSTYCTVLALLEDGCKQGNTANSAKSANGSSFNAFLAKLSQTEKVASDKSARRFELFE